MENFETEELLQKMLEELRSWEGKDIALFANLILTCPSDSPIKYVGDGYFEISNPQ